MPQSDHSPRITPFQGQPRAHPGRLAAGGLVLTGLSLCGEYDAATAGLIAEAFEPLQPRTIPTGVLILDLHQVSFLDTAAALALSKQRDILLARGWHVCAAGPQPVVKMLLDLGLLLGWITPGLDCDEHAQW